MRAASLLLVCAAVAGQAQTAALPHANFYRVGAAADVQVHPRAGYALMGGGTDLDEAFRWLCDRADGGDLVVLRASGTDAYNPYLQKICRLNSVTTIVIPDREAAMEPKVAASIHNAAAIFIAGGDQSKYTRFWRGTWVEAQLRDAAKRGVPIGGTSAGLAVMGEYIYSAEGDQPDDPDLTSEAALGDPFYRQVVVAPDLLGIPLLSGVITDSHFDTRGREGRMLVFLARILEAGTAKRARGIGVDEQTVLLVEADGKARVVGNGEVDFFEASGRPKSCVAGKPLRFSHVSERRVASGASFDLAAWRGSGRVGVVSVTAVNGRPVLSETVGESDASKAK